MSSCKPLRVAGAFMALSMTLMGQSLLSFQGQTLATNGDSVPGLLALEVFGGTSTFDSAVIDDSGRAFFRGRFTGGSATATTDRGLFYGSSREDLVLVVRSGDPEPSGLIPGATLNTATGTGLGGSVRITSNGLMFFGASLNDLNVNVNTSNDTAIYVGFPGGFVPYVREGDPAPGTLGAVMSSSFSSPSQQATSLNDGGIIAFKSNLTGGDVSGTTNNEGLFTGSFGTLSLVARKGDASGPGGETFLALTPAFVLQMNDSGQILFDVSYTAGSGVVPVTTADDRALYVFTPGSGLQQIVREGDPSPIPGATLANPGGTWGVNTGSATFNANGEILIRSDLDGFVVNQGVDSSALILASAAGTTLIARQNDPAPGLPGLFMDAFNNASLQLTDSGRVGFQVSVTGTGVTTADDTTIMTGIPGNLVVVAREGDVAPGTGGSTFGSLNGQAMLMNEAGQILFNNTLVGGTAPGSSLWSWDPILGLQAVVLNGDSIEVQPGVFATVTSQGGVQFGNGDSRPLSFANDGTASLRVGFSGGLGAIMKVRIGSLTTVPNAISVTPGGVQNVYVNAGAANAGFAYIVAGSGAGSTPGMMIQSFVVPLNPDPLFDYSIMFPNIPPLENTLGILDAQGRALARITVPPGSVAVANTTVSLAFGVVDPFGNLVFVSEVGLLNLLP